LSWTIQPVTPNRRVTAMEVERRILQRRETLVNTRPPSKTMLAADERG
jgi:hypothetical protein